MKKIGDLGKRLLTRAEVAEIFQVAPSTITRWAEAGKLPAVKTLGGHRRYEAKVVMELAQCLIQEETSMKQAVMSVPAMYGDHHVVEVRRLLLEMPGVETVNASSCFQTVEVVYDPAKLSEDEITAKLDEVGYLGELAVPIETGLAVTQEAKRNGQTFFRHTTAYAQVRQIVGFAQQVGFTGRPLWPCPGVGVIKRTDLEEVPHA